MPPKMLLIDDDPGFGRVMKRAAKQLRFQLDYWPTLRRRRASSQLLENIDGLILDFELENISATQFLQFFGRYATTIPVIVVSSYEKLPLESFPQSVKAVFSKQRQPAEILRLAAHLFELASENASINRKVG